jgi:hypothetical protein
MIRSILHYHKLTVCLEEHKTYILVEVAITPLGIRCIGIAVPYESRIMPRARGAKAPIAPVPGPGSFLSCTSHRGGYYPTAKRTYNR